MSANVLLLAWFLLGLLVLLTVCGGAAWVFIKAERICIEFGKPKADRTPLKAILNETEHI